MGSSRRCVVALVLLLLCFVELGQAKEEEFEGFFEDGLEREELVETPVVARERVRVDEKPRRVEDLWDEEEFEGLPEEEEQSVFAAPAESLEETIEDAETNPEKTKPQRGPFSPYLEIAGGLVFLAYATVFWFGRKQNEKIALAWATEFAGTDSILEKNFSLLGFGDEPDAPSLVKEGQNTFKFYASGRRYCESLLATLTLRNRQDLLSHLLYLILPARRRCGRSCAWRSTRRCPGRARRPFRARRRRSSSRCPGRRRRSGCGTSRNPCPRSRCPEATEPRSEPTSF